jgi:hypothetical protein
LENISIYDFFNLIFIIILFACQLKKVFLASGNKMVDTKYPDGHDTIKRMHIKYP